MFGRSPGTDPLTEEDCKVLYRPPSDGEESAHAHRVRRITRLEVRIEKAAVDGTPAGPDGSTEGTWTLSRRELEERGSTIHGNLRTRFYVDQEAAEAAG